MKALDWILHADSQQLESDDVNLYQRYALALMAYNFDSDSWYYCPSSDVYSNEKCIVSYGDGFSKTYAVWLSGLSECEWYGVTCSADGIVRAVDLIQNDLIGTIPHELAALNSLQLLAFPFNASPCIFFRLCSCQQIYLTPRFFYRTVHLWNNASRNRLAASPALIGIAWQRVERNHTRFVRSEICYVCSPLTLPLMNSPDSMYDMDKLQLLNLANQYGQVRTYHSHNLHCQTFIIDSP